MVEECLENYKKRFTLEDREAEMMRVTNPLSLFIYPIH